mgnify:CR=1 FL=1
MRNKTRLLGVPIDRVTPESFLHRLEQFITDGEKHIVLYANADCLNQAVFDRRYAKILQEAELVCADGMGVVWASRLTGEPLPERVNVGDMIEPFCALAACKGYRLFLLGGAPGVAQRAAERLKQRFPLLQIVGVRGGYFSTNDVAEVIAQINHVQPHVLLVGMGVPKQEKWMWQHRHVLQVPVLWGVGAAIEYQAGRVPRAPRWMRRSGSEWCFRLLVEPKRLWRRYLLGSAFFVLRAYALLLTDALLVMLAWFGAYWICRGLGQPLGIALNPFAPYLKGVLPIVGIWLVACAGFGLYRRSTAMSALAELAQVIRATWAGMFSTMAVAFLLREFSFGRPVVVLSGALTFVLLSTSRFLTRRLVQRLARQGIGLRRALIVGTGPLAKRLKEEIEMLPMGYDVLGFVNDGEAAYEVPQETILGSLHQLSHFVRDLHVQDVFVASHGLNLHEKLNLLVSQEQESINFHIVSEELETCARRLPMSRVVELPLLHLPFERVNGWYELTKRVFDMVAAGLGFLVCLPLLGVTLVIITLELPGPALFIQERIGKGGKPFRMYKFRTMAAHAPAYAISPNDLTDPRVTQFGRFLRRWSLDELPQLVNVLKGQMSLVGPRPEMPFLVSQYEPWQQQRLAVSPGLTGLWQVLGRKDLLLHRHLEYDLYYVRHRGWLLDLVILLRTIPAVLFRRGAF